MTHEWKILGKYPIPEGLQESLDVIFGESTNPYVLLGCLGDSAVDDYLPDYPGIANVRMAMEEYESTILEHLQGIASKFSSGHTDALDIPDELLTRARTYLICLREHYRTFAMFRKDI